MLAGTVAAALLLDRFTRTPPAPAGDPNETVPVAFACPPTTADGAMPSDEIVPVPADGAFSVNPAFTVLADVALMETAVVLPTAEVVTGKLPDD